MKELKEWDNIPRMMWVWDNDEKDKMKRMVVYITDVNENEYPVIGVNKDGGAANYKHCAEIGKQRRMTNKELSRWLREKPTRERISTFDGCICSIHNYNEKCESEEVRKGIRIRENDSEWREPLVDYDKR